MVLVAWCPSGAALLKSPWLCTVTSPCLVLVVPNTKPGNDIGLTRPGFAFEASSFTDSDATWRINPYYTCTYMYNTCMYMYYTCTHMYNSSGRCFGIAMIDYLFSPPVPVWPYKLLGCKTTNIQTNHFSITYARRREINPRQSQIKRLTK